jgi:hypothetical protein
MRAVPRLCEFYRGICLTTEEKHGKTSVRVRKTSVRLRKPQSQYTIHITKTLTHYKTLTNTHITKPTHTHTHSTHTRTRAHTHTHTHTLQNNIKPPQYKLKQNAQRKATQCGERTVPSF